MGAKLERALINFMLDVHTREHGYTEVLPPFLVNSASLFGTGQLPKFADDLFKCEKHDFWLIPTAEVPVTNLFRDETLDADAAAHQLVRLHAVLPQRGRLLWARRARHHPPAPVSEGGAGEVHAARAELRRAGKADRRRRGHPAAPGAAVPHRGAVAPATWASRPPRPTTSKSGCRGRTATRKSRPARTSKRSRRGARASASRARKGKPEFVHTLNGSGLAVGRTWVAIVENYQQKDGSVIVPEALRPYLGAERIVKQELK